MPRGPLLRDEMVEGLRLCAPILRSLVRRYARLGIDPDDLAQEGALGVLDALRRYDPSFGTLFTTYARWWIRYRMQRHVRSSRSVVSPPETRAVRRARRRLLCGHAGGETFAQIAAELGIHVDDVYIAQSTLHCRDVVIRSPGLSDSRAGVEPSSPEPTPEDLAASSEQRALARRLVDRAVPVLNDRERVIVAERTLSDVPTPLREVGERLSISAERVRQLERRALNKLRDHLEGLGSASVAFECARGWE